MIQGPVLNISALIFNAIQIATLVRHIAQLTIFITKYLLLIYAVIQYGLTD